MKHNTTKAKKSNSTTPQKRVKRVKWNTVGLDLGDRQSRFCALDEGGGTVCEEPVATTEAGLRRVFTRAPMRIALEAGGHSHWVSQLLKSLGHEVIVADPRQLRLISQSGKKTDRVDARTLAQLARVDLGLLHPIEHRDRERQLHLTAVRVRAQLVEQRSAAIHAARGLVKVFGERLPKRSSEANQSAMLQNLDVEVAEQIGPLLKIADQATEQIKICDQHLERIVAEHYPEVKKLRQVRGVGLIVGLTYALVIGDPKRFKRSRQVGCYTGTTPRLDSSGQRNPQLRITKQGDPYLRAMLTQSAQYILGRHGEDCDLRRFGLQLCKRGGKNAKKRAVTAVARKLSVLLHRLWISDQPYDPLYNAKCQAARQTPAAA
jgi:transposase